MAVVKNDSAKITPEEHKKILERMGIKESEDSQLHDQKNDFSQVEEKNLSRVETSEIGGGFIDYCIKMGWIVTIGEKKNLKYYITEEGKVELLEFGIEIR